MGSISCHITPLVINNLGADTHTNTHTEVRTEAILRNQARAGAWFKNWTGQNQNSWTSSAGPV